MKKKAIENIKIVITALILLLTFTLTGVRAKITLLTEALFDDRIAPENALSLRKGRLPNIIYIYADDLGFGDVNAFRSLYGLEHLIETPNLDQMAADGMMFTDHYTACPLCAPARGALLTGKDIGNSTIKENDPSTSAPSLMAGEVTFANIARDNGYATGIFGKWGIGDSVQPSVAHSLPNAMGFDHFLGYNRHDHAHTYFPEFLWMNTERYELRNVSAKLNGPATTKIDYAPDIILSEALQWMEQNKDGPFLMYYPSTLPHFHYEMPAEYLRFQDKSWGDTQKTIASMIYRLDWMVGQIRQKVRDLGLEDNTLIMFSSDNGPTKENNRDTDFFQAGGRFRGLKRDVYEGGIRMPTIAVWPGTISAGSRTGHISGQWDFFATVCEIIGVEPPLDTTGISFLPTLLGQPEKQGQHEYLYFEIHEQGGKAAVRWGDWKGVRLNTDTNIDAPIEIYNVRTDIGEQNNVAAQYPAVKAQIEQYLIEAQGIRIQIDGAKRNFNPQPVAVGEEIYAPMYSILAELGASVEWNEMTSTVKAVKGTNSLALQIGNPVAQVNGSDVVINAPALLIGGNPMVPVRLVAETFGAAVEWDARRRVVNIDMLNLKRVPLSDMTATASSNYGATPPSAAIDGDINTRWHSFYVDAQNRLPGPHNLYIALAKPYLVSGIQMTPRQDGNNNGLITQYNIYVSTDGTNWILAASGTWANNKNSKTVLFTPVNATHVRLESVQSTADLACVAEFSIMYSDGAGLMQLMQERTLPVIK